MGPNRTLELAMIRWGLCCVFQSVPIKFGTTTAAAIGRLKPADAREKLSRLCLANATALGHALTYCLAHGIGCFRILSQIFPLKTHPQYGYEIAELPEGDEIVRRLQACRRFVHQHHLRTCFHPDQFVVLNSRRAEVVESSLREVEYQAEVAEWVGADVINIHGGGAFGDKRRALDDLALAIQRLSPRARERLTVENDDKIFTPSDLLPFCQATGVPLVYDVHHHRCLPDGLTVEEATAVAMKTWNREPLFHLSSPADGWDGPKPERHHEFIDRRDFPDCWRELDVTVEIEARGKERAVLEIMQSQQQ